jgi:CTP synthase
VSEVKYVFVTGGVASSLGKGIVSASLAKLLQARGYSVTIQKLDPYINVDPGTLDPYEHGECYVTLDGAETDLDLGHYERFLNVPTSQANSVTTGKVYQTVINKERNGDYQGKTVQVIPHITDEIKKRIKLLSQDNKFDIVITEIGGTVGDIESLPYIESVRQLRWELGAQSCLVIHLTFVPYLSSTGESKTKPTQHSVKDLLETGIQPDILVLRTDRPLHSDLKRKVALFCNVDEDAVIESVDVSTIYEVPIKMLEQDLDKIAVKKLALPVKKEPDLSEWREFLNKLKNPKHSIAVGIVGKYVELPDAYKSIIESFVHAGSANECKIEIKYIQSEKIDETNLASKLQGLNGILVAPGSGSRGIDGEILTAKYCRENNIPFFGISLGMQCAVIEFARNVLGLEPVTDLLKEGDMRLGGYKCVISKNSKVYDAYGKTEVIERHRNKYEFNNKYLDDFSKHEMEPVGINKELELVEIFELSGHKWFIGTQFYPEYSSTVLNPHPLFVSFVKACI